MVDKNIIQSRFTKLGVVPIDNQHYLYATLDNNLIGIIMNGERPHLVVGHSATAACLDLIENECDTIVQVFVFFGIGDGEKFVRPCLAIQVFLDSPFEMFRTFHRSAF